MPAAQTWKLIEVKLVEMECRPSDVQIIVQGTHLDGNMFMVDESGIIISMKGMMKHVSKHAQSDGGICSALHDCPYIHCITCMYVHTITTQYYNITRKYTINNEHIYIHR